MRALAVAVALAALAAGAAAQVPDSLRTPDPPAAPAPVPAVLTRPDPAPVDTAASRRARRAVTRALLAPGLGQLYNGQPVKAPVATALVVGALAHAVNRQQQYTTYRRATVFAGCQVDPGILVNPRTGAVTIDPDRIVRCVGEAQGYRDEWEELGAPAFAAIGSPGGPRDQARGQRDVAVLLVAVAYAAQALDAYVFAQLSGFDVSEDVAVQIDPAPGRPALSLRVRL